MKLLLNPTSNANGLVLLRCIFFWCLFQVMSFVVAPIVPIFPTEWRNLAYGGFGTLSAFLITWLFLKYEKKSFNEVGLVWQRDTLMRFLKGLLIGSAIFGLMLSALVTLTPLQFQLNTTPFQPRAESKKQIR